MATYVNNLRLKEITTGDEDGTWGTSTNTNLELITDGFSLGTKQMAADANETFTMPDATADATRSLYLKITSAASLTATREVTLGPNTVSKTWIIENATTGSQIITIKQGSGATVNVANGSKVMVVTDGAGAGAAVFNANVSVGLTTPAITTGLDDSAGNLVIPFDANQYFSGTFSDKVTVAGNTGTALTINANLANVVTATLNGNATLTLATPNAVANRSTSFTLILTNDGTPNRTVALAGGTFYYPGGSISRTTTANAIDIWFFFSPDGGTSWYVTLPMKNLTT
tara:strand:+ start:231 stop:1088 length:858 start_codon:yes stop_codon:yes gene_type:complete